MSEDPKGAQLSLVGSVDSAVQSLASEWRERFEPDTFRSDGRSGDIEIGLVLLSVEWGSGLSPNTWEELRRNLALLERTEQSFWDSRLPWELSLSARRGSRPVKVLTGNLAHHNSAARGWVMTLAWMARPLLDPDQAIPFLLSNVADKISGPYRAAGLAAELVGEEDFWRMAEPFRPPEKWESQYRRRLEELRETSLLTIQASFWKQEAYFRRLLMDAVFGSS